MQPAPETVDVVIDGIPVRVIAGTTVAAAILIAGKEHFRTSVSGEARGPLWQTFMNCAKRDTSSARIAVQMIAAYAHLGPFSRKVIDAIDTRLAALDNETVMPAATVDVTAA